MSAPRRRLLGALAVVAGLLLAARLGATVFADHAWYVAAGAGSLWQAKFWHAVTLHGATWLAGTVFAFANLYAVRSSVLRFAMPRRVADLEFAAEIPGRLLVAVAALVAAGIGALLTFVQDSWTRFAVFRYLAGVDLERDPHLGGDVASFWIGWLPLERAWYTWAQATLIAVTCLVVVLYALTSSLRWERGALHVNTHVRRHLSALGALLLLLLAWGYRLERFLLLVNGGRDGTDGFVGYTDVRVALTALLVLSVLTAACAVLVFWAGYTGQTRLAFGTVTFVIVMAIALQQIAPSAARWMARGVPEQVRVRPYREIQEAFTQRAYGLDSTFQVGDATTRFSDLSALAGRISLWDPAILRAAAERETRRRAPVGGIGWRGGADGLQATLMLRDAEPDTSAPGAGWAAAVMPAAEVDGGGAGMPPRVDVRPVAPVRLWPGAPGYAVVPDDEAPIAAPPLGGGWRRLAFALSTQNLRLFLDRGSGPQARLLRHRDVRTWLARLAPVFVQGTEVSPLLAGDTLYWAVALYSSARTYPLSVPLAPTVHGAAPGEAQPTKYFRHAATALVNAHSGAVAFVPAPELDPLARAWFDRFPAHVRAARRLPPSLLQQLPPPRASGRARVVAFTRVGTATQEPLPLDIVAAAPPDTTAGAGGDLPLRLAASGQFPVLDLPLVRRDDEGVAALASLSGGASPRLVIHRLTATGPAWSALLAELQRALPDSQAGEGRLQRGGVRVVPTEAGFVYVQPSYRVAFDAVPVLHGVALLATDSLRRGATLRALVQAPASDSASGGGPAGTAPAEAPSVLYRRMQEALRRGDWEAFGAAFRALGRTLGVPDRP